MSDNTHTNPLAMTAFLVAVLLVFGAVGRFDYQDELEQENRTLRATAARCQLAMSRRDAAEEPRHDQP